ncbi:MAG: M48 family metalloprotease [Candidatus Omnitrophica bacterium]|nr:M48 family metalloprotease [Candidatus Omnitrophota bacterium]
MRFKSLYMGFFCIMLLGGCATISGPKVSKEEIEKAREELKLRALTYKIQNLQRLYQIGSRLMAALAKESHQIKIKPQAYLGITCSAIDKYLQQIYGLEADKGVAIIVVKVDSPAYQAGLQPGDVVVSLNKNKIETMNRLNALSAKFKAGEVVHIDIIRKTEPKAFAVKLVQIPADYPILMMDSSEVNAATDGKALYVTYGLLNFAKSDDEIAAVLGHELAHAVRGHVSRAQGGNALGFLASLAAGIAMDQVSPGMGNTVMRGVDQLSRIFNAKYSRELEKEADYFGARFVYFAGFDANTCATVEERFAIEIPATMTQSYFSTHPSSPERVARIKKIVAELEAGLEPTPGLENKAPRTLN